MTPVALRVWGDHTEAPSGWARFTTDGDVLNGPAKKPLEKLKVDE